MIEKRTAWILLALAVAFFVIVLVVGWFLLKSELLSANCSDFDSYNNAVQAFKMGNKGLDGNNNDIPCEYLK